MKLDFKNIKNTIKSGLKNKLSPEAIAEKVGEQVAKKYMDDSLDKNALRLRRLIPQYGAGMIANEFFKGTKKEIKKLVKEGKSNEEILQPCRDSKNYLALLQELGLNIDTVEGLVLSVRNGNTGEETDHRKEWLFNSPKSQPCPKCNKNSKRTYTTEENKQHVAFYKCNVHGKFKITINK